MIYKRRTIFVGNRSDAEKDWAFHEVVRVASKAINDVYSLCQSAIRGYSD